MIMKTWRTKLVPVSPRNMLSNVSIWISYFLFAFGKLPSLQWDTYQKERELLYEEPKALRKTGKLSTHHGTYTDCEVKRRCVKNSAFS